MTTTVEETEAATKAAKRIIKAISALSPWVRLNLAMALAAESSTTLSSIGDALLGQDDPVAAMAHSLLVEVFIGDIEDVAPKLGDTEPWCTIRKSLEEVTRAWRSAHPTFRTRRDFAARAQRWEQEARERAQDALPEEMVFQPDLTAVKTREPRVCRRCSRPTISSRHWYCVECRPRPAPTYGQGPLPRRLQSTKEKGYTGKHIAARKRWAAKVEAGGVECGRCGRIIAPGAPWDLSHPGDDKSLSPVPWHRFCNRSYASRVTRRRRRDSDQ